MYIFYEKKCTKQYDFNYSCEREKQEMHSNHMVNISEHSEGSILKTCKKFLFSF